MSCYMTLFVHTLHSKIGHLLYVLGGRPVSYNTSCVKNKTKNQQRKPKTKQNTKQKNTKHKTQNPKQNKTKQNKTKQNKTK